jgi:hypothetical protein
MLLGRWFRADTVDKDSTDLPLSPSYDVFTLVSPPLLSLSIFTRGDNSSYCNMPVFLLTPWRYSSCRTLAASHTVCEVSWQQIFTRWGRQPRAQPPTWRTRVSLLVWHLPRNLSGMGGPTSSYAAADIALVFIVVHKPPHPATRCFWQGGDTIEGGNMPIQLLNCNERKEFLPFATFLNHHFRVLVRT